MSTSHDQIVRTIEQAYIHGIHIDQDEERVRAGFHPDFAMLVPRDDGLGKVDPMQFLSMMKTRRAEHPETFATPVTFEVPLVGLEGNAAVARVEVSRGEKHLFTDFQLLYRLDERWQIVSKIFQAHP